MGVLDVVVRANDVLVGGPDRFDIAEQAGGMDVDDFRGVGRVEAF